MPGQWYSARMFNVSLLDLLTASAGPLLVGLDLGDIDPDKLRAKLAAELEDLRPDPEPEPQKPTRRDRAIMDAAADLYEAAQAFFEASRWINSEGLPSPAGPVAIISTEDVDRAKAARAVLCSALDRWPTAHR